MAGAWSLAIAWPMYQNITIGPEALTLLGMRRADLVVLIILVSLAVPALVVGVAALAGRLAGPAVRSWILAAAIAVIAGLFCWQQVDMSGPAVRLLLPLAAAVGLGWLLLKSQFVRNFAMFLGLAVPVVIVAFVVRYPVWAEAGPHEKGAEIAEIEADTPVVMVIFDELPLAALENRRGRIDSELFPNFAALAAASNSYPNMTASATNTVNAVPSILTGKPPTVGYHEELTPPGLADYPDNLCRIAEAGGYELNSYEPITDLCKRNLSLGGRVSAAIRRGAGAAPETMNVNLTPGKLAARAADKLASLFKQPYDGFRFDRALAVDDFIGGLSSDKRSFSLLHITLPHVFWLFNPDGTRYESNRFNGVESLISPASKAQVTHDLQQMMLQLAYTDTQLGRIIDRMKEQGTWDDALFIVTADHGAGFLPGGNRRIVEDANAGWLLPVPLFVKFPDQERGKVLRGGVDSLDIAPTVFDVLGIDPPDELPGTSLAGDANPPLSDEVTSHGTFGTVEMDRKKVTALERAAIRQRNAAFPGGQMFGLAGHDDLIGTDPAAKGLEPIESTPDDPVALATVDLESEFRPSYFRTTIDSPGKPGRAVAVALNDRIVATTTTWTDETTGNEVTGVNLPSGEFIQGANEVELYELPR